MRTPSPGSAVEVTWVIDRNEARAGALASRLDGARVAPDLQHAGWRSRCGRSASVYAACLARAPRYACDGGWLRRPVEKPFAETAEATSQLLDIAAARGRLVCPVHQFLFQPGVRRALSEIKRFGPLLHADTVACSGCGRCLRSGSGPPRGGDPAPPVSAAEAARQPASSRLALACGAHSTRGRCAPPPQQMVCPYRCSCQLTAARRPTRYD